jgi:hypothetical protein
VDIKSILHLYPGMKQINVHCSPTVSVDFTKERKHFLSIKVHTIILHILLIDFHFIKSKSPTLFLHYDHLNFMFGFRCTKASSTRLWTKNLEISTFNFRVLASETGYSPHCAPPDCPFRPTKICSRETKKKTSCLWCVLYQSVDPRLQYLFKRYPGSTITGAIE